MRAAICDDILSDRQRLVEYIKRYIGENCTDDLELRKYDCAEALLADERIPDVLFLNIYMRATNGIDAAKQLCSRGHSDGIILPQHQERSARRTTRSMRWITRPNRFLTNGFSKPCGKTATP